MSNLNGTVVTFVVQSLASSWSDVANGSFDTLEAAQQKQSDSIAALPQSRFRLIKRQVQTYTNTSETVLDDGTAWIVQFQVNGGAWTVSPDTLVGITRRQADAIIAAKPVQQGTEYRKVQIIIPGLGL